MGIQNSFGNASSHILRYQLAENNPAPFLLGPVIPLGQPFGVEVDLTLCHHFGGAFDGATENFVGASGCGNDGPLRDLNLVPFQSVNDDFPMYVEVFFPPPISIAYSYDSLPKGEASNFAVSLSNLPKV